MFLQYDREKSNNEKRMKIRLLVDAGAELDKLTGSSDAVSLPGRAGATLETSADAMLMFDGI